ncbi:MAG: fasciclin domain-containing protein [Planctomycetota bacterium]
MKKNVTNLSIVSLCVVCCLGLLLHAEHPKKAPENIVDTAIGAGSFKTLVTALKAADLVDTLKGDGPFTVFAPDDDAFAELPEGKLEDLLKPENKEELQGVLKFHVVSGKLMAADVMTKKSLKTLQGGDLEVTVDDDTVKVGGAKVKSTDIKCSNGVIHVITKVLMP